MGVANFDDGVPSNQKILAAGATASWLWFCGVIYCRRGLTDGFIPMKVVPTLSIGLKSPLTYAARLVEVGLWEQTVSGFYVHDFLDWNPSKAQVEGYRKRDRERKQAKHGHEPDPPRNPFGFHAESGPESDRIPRDEALAGATRAGGKSKSSSESESEEVESTEKSARETAAVPAAWRTRAAAASPSIMAPPLAHRSHAWCCDRDGLCVPEKLHRDFIGKLGGADAHERLLAWYPVTLTRFDGQPIGETVWRFWENCFAQWVGSATSAATESHRRAIGPRYGRAAECPHDPPCTSRTFCAAKQQEESVTE